MSKMMKISQKGKKGGCAMAIETGKRLAAPGARALLIDKEHKGDAKIFMEENIPGTLDELLEESCKGSFNILRGVV